MYNIVDPTGGQFTKQTTSEADVAAASTPKPPDEPLVQLPKQGWTKDLGILPPFPEMNIRTHLCTSGKSAKGPSTLISKPERKGWQFFVEQYMGCYELSSPASSDMVFVKAKCWRSQIRHGTPVVMWCALSKKPPHNVVKADCECVAGAGGVCNHVFALLYQTNAFSKSDHIKFVPDELTKTDLPMLWTKPRRHGLGAEPIMECTVKKARMSMPSSKTVNCTLYEARVPTAIPNNSDKIQQAQEKLSEKNPLFGFTYMPTADNNTTQYVRTSLGPFTPVGSVLSYQLALTEGNFTVDCRTNFDMLNCTRNCDIQTTYPTLPLDMDTTDLYIPDANMTDDMRTFISDLLLDKDAIRRLEEATRLQSDSTMWWDARKFRLTASNFSEITRRRQGNCDKFVTRLTTRPNLSTDKLPESLKHGRTNEAKAANQYDRYMRNLGRHVTTHDSGVIVRPDMPYLGCTPDKKVIDYSSHPHFGILEIKCPYKYKSITPEEAAKINDPTFCLEFTNGQTRLKTNHAYYVQMQGQMAMCGTTWCDFVVYTFKGMHIERVQENKVFQAEMLTKLNNFYFERFVPTLLKQISS